MIKIDGKVGVAKTSLGMRYLIIPLKYDLLAKTPLSILICFISSFNLIGSRKFLNIIFYII